MANEVTVAEESIYSGRVVHLRVATVRLPDGRLAAREIVTHPDAVAILPVDGQGNVLLVRQFRKAVEQDLLEIPAGLMEGGEDPVATARRELAEEAGFAADNLERLTGFFTSAGFCTEYIHLFLATGLHPVARRPAWDEDIATVWLPLAQALAMIERGEVRDAKTIIALLMVARGSHAATRRHRKAAKG